MNLKRLASLEGTVILDVQKPVRESRRSSLFHSPLRILEAWRAEEVRDTLREAERLAEEGFVLAGFIAYEAALAFDLSAHPPVPDVPLVWLGVYSESAPPPNEAWYDSEPNETTDAEISGGSFNVTKAEYLKDVERVREFAELLGL